MAPFILKDGVTETLLSNASGILQKEFVEKQPGFIKRELVKKSAREFVDIIYWDNQVNANKDMQQTKNSPACYAYFQLLADTDHRNQDAGVAHFEVLNEYKK